MSINEYMPEDDECMDAHDGKCQGETHYRMSLSGTGTSYPRCDHHWGQRLDREQEIRERYPYNAPADFDPSYAGEVWGEDDY